MDYSNVAVIFAGTVLLANIFLNEYLFGLNIPLIILALVLLGITQLKKRSHGKRDD